MHLLVKNMVCARCVMAVEKLLTELDLPFKQVQLGEVILKDRPPTEQLLLLDEHLIQLGFERIDDRKTATIERVKRLIIERIQDQTPIPQGYVWSEWLSESLHMEYSGLSSLFSSIEAVTLEQFIIRQKVEYIKEWLVYEEKTLSELAWKLGYSSTAHLSNQFRKVTGMSPSAFKSLQNRTQLRVGRDAI